MAALNFPNSPTVNDEVELGGKTYKWDGVKWLMIKVITPTAQALAPTITEVSTTDDSITFTITNNDASTAVILWEIGDTTPDENSLELAADTTSSNITVTGLTEGTEYIVFATANVTGKVKSNVTQLAIETDLFSPATISNLFLWYDANQITGLSNNDQVSQWNDLSGNNDHLTQSTAGARPIYLTSGVNGLPSVRFDGIDDVMITSSSPKSQPITAIVAMKYNSVSGENNNIFDGRLNNRRNLFNISTTQHVVFAGTNLSWNSAPVLNTNKIFTAIFNGSSSIIRKDGSQKVTGNAGTNQLEGFTLGASSGNGMAADVGEVILYNKLLTTQELADVEQYLANKWGVTL